MRNHRPNPKHTKEGRVLAGAVVQRNDAVRRWSALAYRIADGERVSLVRVRRLAAEVARADVRLATAGVLLTRRLRRRS